MTNFTVRGDGLNQPENGLPAFDTAYTERVRAWQPSDNGLITANFPPRCPSQQNVLAGYYFLQRVRVPAGTIITNVHVGVSVAGAGLTYAAAAVYEQDGTQVGITASQITAWQSLGHKLMPLGTPIAAKGSARWVWVGLAAAGTTVPWLGIGAPSGMNFISANMAQPIAAGYVVGTPPLPASLTMTLTSFLEFWIGLS